MIARPGAWGLAILAAAGVLGGSASAPAQSKRYPPTPVDKDAEGAARSELWSAAITPERHAYQSLLRTAAEALSQRTDDHTLAAIRQLDEAIRLLPREPEAYRLRGEAHLKLQDWAGCAADLATADLARQQRDVPPKEPAELRRDLGLCQARAGKLTDAEHTLAGAAAAGSASGELWMRLGEVRIAMGKLDEAITALTAARSASEQATQAMIHFLLAVAYDRARRPADALVEAREGEKLDHALSTLQNPVVPPLGAGEVDYALGLVYSADPPRLSYALAYFRRFVKTAPDSPWRKRAEEHLRELGASELPGALRHSGTALLDADAARAAVRRALPQMRACLAQFPMIVIEVDISRAGPRTPASDPQRPRFANPPDGVTVRRAVGDLSDDDLAVIQRCLSPIATRLALPAVKERDTYYKAQFDIVGP